MQNHSEDNDSVSAEQEEALDYEHGANLGDARGGRSKAAPGIRVGGRVGGMSGKEEGAERVLLEWGKARADLASLETIYDASNHQQFESIEDARNRVTRTKRAAMLFGDRLYAATYGDGNGERK